MAFVLTYTNLLTNLENYTQRNDPPFLTELPVFIMLGQRRIARDLKILGMRVVANDALLPGNPKLAKPARWFNTSTFNVGTPNTNTPVKIPVPLRTYDYCLQYNPDPSVQGFPKYISDFDFTTWYIVPTPDEAYLCEYAYYQVPQLIDETVSTNFMTESCPDALLYACLLETAVYLKDDDRIKTWQLYYDTARQALAKEDMQRMYDNYSVNRGEGGA